MLSGVRTIAAALLLALAAAPAALAAQVEGEPADDAAAAALGRDYLIGAWTDSEDCAAAVAFDDDGTFVTPEGGEGMWEFDGARLILAGAGGIRSLRIVPVDADTMEVINEDGSRGRSIRCAAETGDGDGAGFVALDIA